MTTHIYPFQTQILIREELLHRYVIALDENDTDTLREVLSKAKGDKELQELIDQMEIAFACP